LCFFTINQNSSYDEVSCISAEGLVKLKNADKSIREGGFIDPLKRNDRILTLDDYEPYFVYGTKHTNFDSEIH